MSEPIRPIGGYPRLTEAERDVRDGRFDAAAGQVIQHLREYPNEPRGVALLGRIALRTGALVQAEHRGVLEDPPDDLVRQRLVPQ